MPLKRSLVQRGLDDSSSDDDDYVIFSAAQIVHTYSNAKRSHGGSVLGHRVLYRDRKGGHERMFQDYLAVNPTYTLKFFVEGCCSFTSVWIVLSAELLFECLKFSLFSSGTGCLGIFSYA